MHLVVSPWTTSRHCQVTRLVVSKTSETQCTHTTAEPPSLNGVRWSWIPIHLHGLPFEGPPALGVLLTRPTLVYALRCPVVLAPRLLAAFL